jgi:hypothetical protein
MAIVTSPFGATDSSASDSIARRFDANVKRFPAKDGARAVRERHRQARQLRFEPGVRRRVSGQRRCLQGRHEAIPDEIHHRRHVAGAGRDRDDGVVLRKDEAELAVGAVAPVEAVAAAPELVAVALLPVARRRTAVRHLP